MATSFSLSDHLLPHDSAASKVQVTSLAAGYVLPVTLLHSLDGRCAASALPLANSIAACHQVSDHPRWSRATRPVAASSICSRLVVLEVLHLQLRQDRGMYRRTIAQPRLKTPRINVDIGLRHPRFMLPVILS